MQAIKYGMREPSVDSVNDGRSRYVPSSVYSGAGPVDDSPALAQGHSFMSGALRGPFEEQETPPARFTQPPQNAPRNSTLLNINDPVAMHLLTETAISDSREFEVLSFEEVEQLKKERGFLRGKIETTRRKLALESKLRDAAQSLNRLYSTRESPDAAASPKKTRRSLLGSRHSGNEVVHRADDEYAASTKKVEELSRELFHLEKRLQELDRRILQHTAGILQMTHRGLKKNIRRNELPRSPESMTSQLNGRGSVIDARDEFDERSLYQVPDYVTEFGQIPHGMTKGRAGPRPVDGFATRLQELNQRLHLMITQASLQEHFDPPPQPSDEHMVGGGVDAQIQAYLGYMSQGLDAMEAAQARSNAAVQQSIFDTEEQLEDVNLRLHDMLERTNSVGHSPVLLQDEPRGKDLNSQLAFSSTVIERLNKRVETLLEQKDILTRQIQQQRELNSKSDAQRDAKIHELVAELEESKRFQSNSEQEAQHSRDQINLLMEELDLAKQQSVLLEHERGADESKALELERAARKEVEAKFLTELQAKQEEHSQLQSEIQQTRMEVAQAQAAHEEVVNDLRRQVDALTSAKAEAESELSKLRAEMQELESEVVRAQTELTVVKAELDGAYGTRAQRAADVSMNPAIQKEIDDLNMRNNELESQVNNLRREHEAKDTSSVELQNKVAALQRELKETIEEYEVMTRQSIDDEKERERLEEKVDALQQQCEALESQLNEEKVKGLGSKVSSPTETTSTMVLKNEFKKMMRETRAENLKVLKAEQEERRRLEGIIKSLKKDLQQRHSQKEPPSTPIEVVDSR